MTDPAPLRDLLRSHTDRLGTDDSNHVGIIWRHWRDIVGDAIASHAEPTSLRDGVLRVRTDAPTWASEISYLGEDIATKANRHVGRDAVREVRVWTSPEPIRAPRVTPGSARVEASDRGVESSGSDDPQSALGAAYAAWKKRWSRARSRTHQKR
ncbi:MAG TPA: DUF721 domain-containing protein [Vicinamibacterales bacterium]|nr:DUF721 domain-containing protein [Vicinamibacterales bacterium]